MLAGPDKFFGIRVTGQAPFHVQRVLLHHERHLIDLTVAGYAGHALGDVNAVVEVNVIRKVVHFDPFHGLAGLHAFADGREHRRVGKNLRMTLHACRGRRDAGESTFFDAGVTETAVDTDAADVMFMTKRHALFAGNADLSVVRSPGEYAAQHKQTNDSTQRSNDGEFCDGVDAFRK